MKNHQLRLGSVVLSLFLVFPALALAQQAVGIVTALKGTAQLTLAATQTALSFKDNLILRDLIDTQEKSLTRVLFGGKSTVTVRELSRLEVREELLPGGATRTIHDLSSGSILVNVARSLMRRGDEVQIRTPNAIAAVRGSTILAQYNAALAQSVFVLLTGSAIVTPQGQPSITLTPNTSVNVTGSSTTGVQAGAVGAVTQAEATEIVEASEVEAAVKEEANQEQTAKVQTEQAAELATAIVEAVTGEPLTALQDTEQGAQGTEVETTGTEQIVETIAQSPPQTAIEQGGTPVVEVTSEEPAPSSGGGTVSDEAAAARVLPFTFKADTTSSDNPFFQVTNETIDISGNLITVNSGVTVTLDGKLVFIDPSTITTTGSLVLINGASLTLGGSLLNSENSTITADTLLDLSNKSTLTLTAGPVIKIVGGSLTADALIDGDKSGNTFNVTGSLLDLKDTTVTLRVLGDNPISTPDVDDLNLTLAANEPLFRVDNSTLKITGTTNNEELIFINVEDISGGTFKGVGLIAKNSSTISNKGGGLLEIKGTSLTTTSTDALVQITGSTVETFTDAMFEIEPPPSGSTSVTMSGPLLSASATSTLTSERNFFEIRNSSSLTSNTTSAFIEFDTSTVNVGTTSADTHFFQFLSSSTATFKGPLLSATGTTLNVSRFFFEVVGGSQFTNTGTSAVLQLTNSPLAARSGAGILDDFLFLSGSGSKINVAGTLLSATNSNLTLSGDIFNIASTSPSGSQLTTTSSDPLVLLSGGTHSIGLDLFLVTGLSTTDQPITGSEASFTVNSTSALNPIGALFKATNAAEITVTNAVELDKALFQATLPIIELVGSNTKITSSNTFVDIGDGGASKLVLKGPVIALDNSLIKVTTGPLLSLKNGSTMDVSGDLLKLISGSTINVVNGPLIKVDGSGSALDVTGALVNFGGTGGNTIIVRNGLCSGSCVTLGSPAINVFKPSGTITISGTSIQNSSLGSIDVTSTDAVIQTANGGTVNIQGN